MDAKTHKKSKRQPKANSRGADSGPKLSDDTISYFKRVEETIKEGFSSDEDQEIFVDNVFEEILKEAIEVCQCHMTSHIIEDLVTIATVSNLRSLLKVFSNDWNSVHKNKCASHVLQAVLMSLPKLMCKSLSQFVPQADVSVENGDETDSEVAIIQTMLNLTLVILEEIDQSICHIYASHILRALLQVLGGTYVSNTVLKSRSSRNKDRELGTKPKDFKFADYSIPDAFRQKLKKICKTVYKMENLNMMLVNMNANPVIQTLMIVLSRVEPELNQKLIHKIIKASRIKEVDTGPEDTGTVRLPPVAVDSVGSFLIEQIVSLATTDLYEELLNQLFKGRLIQFAIHPTANFVLQKLFQSCPNKQLFEVMFSELSDNIEDVLAMNHFGVITALANACLQLKTKQDKFVKKLMAAFHCSEPESRQLTLVQLLASFNTYDMFFDEGDENLESKTLSGINYHGSILLQTLVKFKHPDVVVNSLLALTPADIRTLSCDTCGSHVIDALFQSTTVNDKQKDMMLRKFLGLLVDIACDKCGSRALESVWRNINVKQKTLLAEELSRQQDKVHSDRFGRHVYNNLALRLFATRKNDWLGLQGQEKKKRELFKDLMDKEDQMISKKKQRLSKGKMRN